MNERVEPQIKSLYSVQILGNGEQKKICISTRFTQLVLTLYLETKNVILAACVLTC